MLVYMRRLHCTVLLKKSRSIMFHACSFFPSITLKSTLVDASSHRRPTYIRAFGVRTKFQIRNKTAIISSVRENFVSDPQTSASDAISTAWGTFRVSVLHPFPRPRGKFFSPPCRLSKSSEQLDCV